MVHNCILNFLLTVSQDLLLTGRSLLSDMLSVSSEGEKTEEMVDCESDFSAVSSS